MGELEKEFAGSDCFRSALERSETRFQALIENLELGIAIIDADHTILKANEALGRMFHKEPEDFLGRKCYGEFGKQPHVCLHCPGSTAMATGQVQEETKEMKDNGNRLHLKIKALPLFCGQKESAGFIEVFQDVTEAKAQEEKLQRNYDLQSVINSILQYSLENTSLESILHKTLTAILSIPWLAFDARGAIFLVEGEADVLTMKVQNGLAVPIFDRCRLVAFGKCLCGKAAVEQKVVFRSKLDEQHEIEYQGMGPHGHFCVPILDGGRTIGVINIYLREGHQWDSREEEFLIAVANTLAGIIRRRQVEEKLQLSLDQVRRNLAGTVQSIALTVESRDPYTAGHQRRVAELALAMAREMGLSQDQMDGLWMAGVIHDLGKLSLPAEILSKPGKLSAIEFELIKTHSRSGYEILRQIEFPNPVARMVLEHHERIDGSGYPQGLTGPEILLESKILSVADVVEAMASHRPYRSALGIEAALADIAAGKDRIYDANAAESCLRLFERGFRFS